MGFMDVNPEPQVEPWMRGPIPGVDTFVAPLLYSFQMAREDLAKYTAGLTVEQIWATPHGFGSVGFHLRHIAGSTDRRRIEPSAMAVRNKRGREEEIRMDYEK